MYRSLRYALPAFLAIVAFEVLFAPRPHDGPIRAIARTTRGSRAPLVTLEVVGNPVKVFDHDKDRQEADNAPDAQVTAWKDAGGTVNLMIPHSEAYRMHGPDLEHLRIDPHKIYSSKNRAGEIREDFHNYSHWLMGPYSLDGRRFYSLAHSEWYACLLDAECERKASNGESADFNSWTSTVNSFVSYDGGASWRLNGRNGMHIVANTAYRWTGSPAHNHKVYLRAFNHSGMFQPTRVIREGNYFYAIVYFIHRDFTRIDPAQSNYEAPIDRSGYVLLRTSDIADPTVWQGWSGGDKFEPLSESRFSVFLPQRNGAALDAAPPQLIYDRRAGCHILIHTLYGGGNAVYYMTSRSLAKPAWSDAVPIRGTAELMTDTVRQRRGFNDANYPSIIDSGSPGFNFEFTAGKPQLFFVTAPDEYGADTLARDLYRVQLSTSYP